MRGKAGRHGAGVTDCDIGVAGLEIKDFVGADHFQSDPGVLVAPVWQARNEPAAGEGVWRRDPQSTVLGRLGQGPERLGESVQSGPQHRKQARALLRQRERTWRPTK